MIGLRLADLELWLDPRDSGVRLALTECHARFAVTGDPGEALTLRVRNRPPYDTEGWRLLFRDGESWQLWRDRADRSVFVPSQHSPPPRQITVDAAFDWGEVLGEFDTNGTKGQAIYPLQDIDMVILANWLAETGDLILHASGVDDEGNGYAFTGPSGAGKSTLVGEMVSHAPVTVLGEDSVILRYQQGQFLIYGTPWHTNPEHCSPGGVPLRKLFFLDRANHHGVEACGPRAGVERLLQNALIPYYNRSGVERILDSLTRMAGEVPFYTIGFEIGADIMERIRDA